MNTTSIHRIAARYFALPIVSAGIIGGAALGMAGMANAATSVPSDPHPGIVAAPEVKAHPAPEAAPGWHGHHGVWHLDHLQPGYHR
jgi:hypothetical protein